jgi:hypothetical protein
MYVLIELHPVDKTGSQCIFDAFATSLGKFLGPRATPAENSAKLADDIQTNNTVWYSTVQYRTSPVLVVQPKKERLHVYAAPRC